MLTKQNTLDKVGSFCVDKINYTRTNVDIICCVVLPLDSVKHGVYQATYEICYDELHGGENCTLFSLMLLSKKYRGSYSGDMMSMLDCHLTNKNNLSLLSIIILSCIQLALYAVQPICELLASAAPIPVGAFTSLYKAKFFETYHQWS